MHEMANTYPFAGLSKQDLFEQTEKFTQYVKEEIGKDKFKKEIGDLQSRLWLVNYDGNVYELFLCGEFLYALLLSTDFYQNQLLKKIS